jgi:hypothetical protein
MPEATFSQIRKSLLSGETLRPSELLERQPAGKLQELAVERGTDSAGLPGLVKGDLDLIVMMALEKNRMRRYQTANGLATDIRRFLTHQPIAARPPSGVYVMAKFIRRNRIGFGIAVMFVILLVAGLAVTAALYERERKAAIEQLRLKNEAQAARNEESRLRRQADARANVARAAFLLDQGRIDEADTLRQAYPLSSIEPSLEAAAVFRSLGDWNAEHGQFRRQPLAVCVEPCPGRQFVADRNHFSPHGRFSLRRTFSLVHPTVLHRPQAPRSGRFAPGRKQYGNVQPARHGCVPRLLQPHARCARSRRRDRRPGRRGRPPRGEAGGNPGADRIRDASRSRRLAAAPR